MKIVELSIFSAVILIFVLNNILEHLLLNWGFREVSDSDDLILPIFGYVIKTIIMVILLHNILQ